LQEFFRPFGLMLESLVSAKFGEGILDTPPEFAVTLRVMVTVEGEKIGIVVYDLLPPAQKVFCVEVLAEALPAP